ncbi:MAG: glycoside hydrolase family 15 protein [Thermodesulfobacteriota bacterium]
MPYKKISDYGIIGNLQTIALVGLDGSIDWLCLPHIDSPSVFGALLDDGKGGRFAITPVGAYESTAAYLPDTNILKTTFRANTGEAHLRDFMPVLTDDNGEAELYRCVRAVEGTVEIEVTFEPRFDYARAEGRVEKRDGTIMASGGGESVTLSSTRDLRCDGRCGRMRLILKKGESVCLLLSRGQAAPEGDISARLQASMKVTEEYWQGWLRKSETGLVVDPGRWKEMVDRSALVLKLLSFNPTGAIAAAATTSLPEEIGGVRNWDYRFTWIRDTSFTLQALYNLGHLRETEDYLRWIQNLLAQHGAKGMQIMYGLRGEADIAEEELPHLEGYRGSRPVRIGNGAYRQRQLDIYGELMDAALKLSNYVGKVDVKMWPFLCDVCDHVVEHWCETDAGIWEVRSDHLHFVYSKLMCWVALDRGIIIARRYGFPADVHRWKETKRAISDEILAEGWYEKKQSFVGHYGGDTLDASVLHIPLTGFLPFNDPRVVSTVEAVQRELCSGGLLYRYRTEDGLAGGEGAFLLCTFWLIDCLIAMGRIKEAEWFLENMVTYSNHLGLFSEEYDTGAREALGNFPQAFTHIGFINSVIALRKAQCRREPGKARAKKRLLPLLEEKVILNRDAPPVDIKYDEIVPELKRVMNTLRGAFFDTERGRVAYELMADSGPYRRYTCLTGALKRLNLNCLATREERLAFWINLYNVMGIHGVVELGVRDSVNEVNGFFTRVLYQISDYTFSLDDIEHGILRGNRRHPGSVLKPFSAGDPRLAFVIDPPDPRIHFTLVCASSSCPPIALYTAQNIEWELTVAGEVFINSGGVVIDRDRKSLSLSRIFDWYGRDFGPDLPARLRYLSRFLYEEADRHFVCDNADILKVEYQEYDWRLNRL